MNKIKTIVNLRETAELLKAIAEELESDKKQEKTIAQLLEEQESENT